MPALPSGLRRESLPVHVAIIMDGNGRWARGRGKSRLAGHRAGTQTVEEIVTECSDLGIKYLTLYAFSAENWSRSKTEVSALMRLLDFFLRAKEELFVKNNVRLAAIGRLDGLPGNVQRSLAEHIRRFSAHTGLTLCLALNYGSRQEITDAVNAALSSGAKSVNEKTFAGYLSTAGMPDPDLVIRTSGELRLSNFLLWQASYAELYFTPVCWPDFNKAQLHKALLDFASRDRRFGGAR